MVEHSLSMRGVLGSMPRFSTLFTGFEPFGGNRVNPSGDYAKALASLYEGSESVVLPVSDDCHAILGNKQGYQFILMLGLDAQATSLKVEICAAYNDRILPSTVNVADMKLPEGVEWSRDAGNYYCNGVYWQILERGQRCLFVHVPPYSQVPFATGLSRLQQLCEQISYSLS